jgi:hypothetical protein
MNYRIQFDLEFDGVRYRPTLKRSPTEANPKCASKQLQEIKQRIATGTFVFEEEFPDYRFVENVAVPQKRRTCDQVYDEFLLACDSRVAKKDLALSRPRAIASFSLRSGERPHQDAGGSRR